MSDRQPIGTGGRVRRRLTVMLALAVAAVAAVGAHAASSGEIRIVRDNYGVPHVYADQLGPLFFGFGYVVAEDLSAAI